MMRPPTSTLIVGYPVVAAPLFPLAGWFGYEAFIGEAPGWVGWTAVLFAWWLGRCCNEAARYRAWRRDWDALDPNAQPRRTALTTARLVAAFALAGLLVYGWIEIGPALADPQSSERSVALMAAGAVCLLWIARHVMRRRPKQPAPTEWIVAQAATRPLPAPSAAEAYARLPDYCRPLLPSEPSRKEHP